MPIVNVIFMLFSSLIDIQPSATLVINSLALQKKARGQRVYNLSAGEPMVPTHPVVIEAAARAMRDGKTLYSPVAGILELRMAVAKWMNERYDTAYGEKNTVVTCGGKFGLYALCQALFRPGDEAVIISPFWVSYPDMVKLFGGKPVMVPTAEEHGWKVEIGALEQAVTPRTKLVFINNVSNPTGALCTREELQKILDWAARHDLVVISDEVYSGLVYDGDTFVSCGSFPEYRDRVAVIQSCSKHFAMTGWRVGFVLGPEKIIETVTTIQSQSTTGTSSISQWAAVAAFENADAIVAGVRTAMQQRRNALHEALRKNFGGRFTVPSGGLYMFISLAALGVSSMDSKMFCERALADGNVAVVPGAAFGQEGYVRLSFGAQEKELGEAVGMLTRYLKG